MSAYVHLCVCVQLGWGLILLFHSSRVTNRINSGLPTEQGDTLAGLFKESITGDGSATDPIVHQSGFIHANQQQRTSHFTGKLRPPPIHLIWASHAGQVCQQNDNKVSTGKDLSCYFVKHITFSELVTLEIRRVNLLFSCCPLFTTQMESN